MSWFLNLGFGSRCVAWCMIDALCICFYCYLSIMSDHFPYVYDYQQLEMFWRNTYSPSDWQYVALPIATALWFLNVSIVVSCFLFLLKWKLVRYVVFAQLPFRLLALLVLGAATVAGNTALGQVGLGCLTVLFFVVETTRLISVGFRNDVSMITNISGTR